jgi:hypothetical protein
MDQKPNKGFGCATFVLIGLAVVLALIAGCGLLTYRGFKSASRVAKEKFIEESRRRGPVSFDEDQLSDYAAYQKGSPLDRDVFLAWKLDPRRTSIGEQAFREKAEGASVSWKLKVVDIATRGEGVVMKCEVPYEIKMRGNMTKTSSVAVNCEFASAARDSLLSLRRGDWAEIAGRVSLDGDQDARILDAHLSSGVAEKP